MSDDRGLIFGYPYLDPICAYCEYKTFKPRKEGRWNYCRFWEEYFPNQGEPNHLPAGQRTCKQWVRKSLQPEDKERFLIDNNLTDPRHKKKRGGINEDTKSKT